MANKKKALAEKTKYRTLRPISFKGERVERGTVIGLSAEDIENVNLDHVELVDAVKEEVKKEEEKKEELSKQEGSDIEI